MPFDTHLRRGHPVTFTVLALLSFILMCISASLVSSYNRDNDYPSGALKDRIRFLLFVSIWTLLFSVAYIVGFLTTASSFLFSIASHAIWLFVTWLFWLAGAAAMTDVLNGGLDCDNYEGGHCDTLNASLAFAWLSWIVTTFAFGVILFIGARSARSGNGFGEGLLA